MMLVENVRKLLIPSTTATLILAVLPGLAMFVCGSEILPWNTPLVNTGLGGLPVATSKLARPLQSPASATVSQAVESRV